jgi:hypothetical protein
MNGGVGATSKYSRGNTSATLTKKWKESQEDIKTAKSGIACDRLIALHRFKEDYAKRKKLRLLEEVRNIELLW